MNTLFQQVLLWVTVTVACIPVCSQESSEPSDRLRHFVSHIEAFNRMFPREQVYLHFDNTGYFMDETIWYKAYVVNPFDHRVSELSKVLYVELLTPEGRILQTQKLKIEDGQAHGQLPLTKLLHAGFYEIRSYTAYMLNGENPSYFSRVFPVFNVPKEPYDSLTYRSPRMLRPTNSQRLPDMRPKRDRGKEMNLAFYPEGGKQVAGLDSRIVFKATDKDGNPMDVSGCVRNSRGEELCTFASLHDGMGYFHLRAEQDEEYHAEVVSANGDSKRFKLPRAISHGCVMTVHNLRDSYMTVALSKSIGTRLPAMGLTLMSNGKLVGFEEIHWGEKDELLLRIPKGEFPPGILQLTLFDKDGRVHAERMTFVHPKRRVRVSYDLTVADSQEGGMTEVSLGVTDGAGAPVPSTLSLSIRDREKDTPHNDAYSGRMDASLLLGSELKGYIHHIDYYLESDDAAHRLALDLLLCVQGWKGHAWEKMVKPETFIVKYPVEEGLVVRGDVTSLVLSRTKDNINLKLYLYNEAGGKLTGHTYTDGNGRFAFASEDFYGRWNMILTTSEKNRKRLKEMDINIHKVMGPERRSYAYQETSLTLPSVHRSLPKKDYVELSDSIEGVWENLLPEVKVKAAREWETSRVRRWSNIIYDMDDERMQMDDTGGMYMEDVYDWLMKKNPYFSHTVDWDTGWDDIKYIPSYKGRPIKFLICRTGTGVETEEQHEHAISLGDLSVNDIDAVAVSDKPHAQRFLLPSEEIMPGLAADDTLREKNYVVVTIFVRNDYHKNKRKDSRGVRSSKMDGYTQPVRFYIQDYSRTALPEERKRQRTLYWNPCLKTDEAGKVKIQFHSGASLENLNVDYESVSADGYMNF